MRKKILKQLAFEAPKNLESMVCSCLEAAIGIPPVAFSKPEFPMTEIVYYEDTSNGLELEGIRPFIESVLQLLVKERVLSRLPKLQDRVIPHENWAESWKRHFKPLLIRKKLWILPPWSKRRVVQGQWAVVMDPGLSFGTGQHPTTRFCLGQLVDFRRADTRQSMLDLGTGSGILAIAAAKMGYESIRAIDNYSDSTLIARENARINLVNKHILFETKDIQDFKPSKKRQWDVVCANLLDSLLIQECDRISSLVKPGGLLALAGILDSQFERVASAYRHAGMTLFSTRKVGEWKSGSFKFG